MATAKIIVGFQDDVSEDDVREALDRISLEIMARPEVGLVSAVVQDTAPNLSITREITEADKSFDLMMLEAQVGFDCSLIHDGHYPDEDVPDA